MNVADVKDFEKRLTTLISEFGMDNEVGMPDFILAQHLVMNLATLHTTGVNLNQFYNQVEQEKQEQAAGD